MGLHTYKPVFTLIVPYIDIVINAFYGTKYVIFGIDLKILVAIQYKVSYNLLKQKTAGKLYEIH